MSAETLSRFPAQSDGGGMDRPPLRPTENYDDEPERDNDPTGILRRAHTERYGASAAARFMGVSPDAIAQAARMRKTSEGDPRSN